MAASISRCRVGVLISLAWCTRSQPEVYHKSTVLTMGMDSNCIVGVSCESDAAANPPKKEDTGHTFEKKSNVPSGRKGRLRFTHEIVMNGAANAEELIVARVIGEPKHIPAHGSPPKVIEEFVGRADSG